MLVGKIVKGHPMREFDGYANPEATRKKIAHSVFKKDDCYFLTGELFAATTCILGVFTTGPPLYYEYLI